MEKFILINCTKDEFETIFNDWLVMYASELKDKTFFEFAEIKQNVFILKIDKSIDDTDFFFMINNFAFPFVYKKTFEVEGYAYASKHKKILNKNIYVFINKQDREFDNVWITTEDNETYKFDFEKKLKKMTSANDFKYKKTNISDLSISYKQIIIDKKELLEKTERKEKEEKKQKLNKRFKILSTVSFVGLLILVMMNPAVFNNVLITFPVSLLYLWFIFDYKIFFDANKTVICVLLTLLLIAFGTSTLNLFSAVITTIPLSEIIILLLVNKFWSTKLNVIMSSEWDGFFGVVVFGSLASLISALIFYPILKILFPLLK